MSAVRELTAALISGGMDPVDAAVLIARAGVELAPRADTRTPGARRQAAYRERNKSSQNITEVTETEASPTVTNRNETSQSDASSLSKEEKKEIKKKEKRESRASQIPEGWRPDERRWLDAIARIGSVERAEVELTKFTNHALTNGRVCKNWNAAWANWMIRALEWGNGHRTIENRADTAAGRATAREANFLAAVARGSVQALKNGNGAGSDWSISEGRSPPEDDASEREAAWADYEARRGAR